MRQSSSSSDSHAKLTDERFSLGLLRDHLRKHFSGRSTCDEVSNDPPDLTATLPNGERWGVEVTRAYQEVKLPGKDKTASSEARYSNLKRWADSIRERTAGMRELGYSLFLGPGSLGLDPDATPRFDEKWKEDSERAIFEHIKSRSTNVLRFPGLWFKPGEPGKRWTVAVSPGGSAPISLVTTSMLRKTLVSKARMVPKWNGSFDQKWLLVLNFYPLADDVSDVKSIIEELARSERGVQRFDGILWYDRFRSDLVEVPIGSHTDERFARGLLRDHLRRHFGDGSTCDEISNDPPDLTATLPNGERWGVEVTRTYQGTGLAGKDKVASSEALYSNLKRWADSIGEKTAAMRELDYSLFLGPGSLALDPDRTPRFDKKWKEDSERAIYEHIESRNTNILRRPGLWFKPGEPGKRWTVAVSPGGSAPVSLVTTSMLRKTLVSKARMVPKWNGSFDQKWLLVLNFYPLADDISKVKSIIEELARSEHELLRFDGILWCDRFGPDLVEVPIGSVSLPK